MKESITTAIHPEVLFEMKRQNQKISSDRNSNVFNIPNNQFQCTKKTIQNESRTPFYSKSGSQFSFQTRTHVFCTTRCNSVDAILPVVVSPPHQLVSYFKPDVSFISEVTSNNFVNLCCNIKELENQYLRIVYEIVDLKHVLH